MTGYQIFVMVELARIAGLIEKTLEYDTTWEKAEKLYSEFQSSEFDDPNEPEYECIEKFLANYAEIELLKFLSTCEKVQTNDSEAYAAEQIGKGFYSIRINNVYYWIDGKNYTISEDDKLVLTFGDGFVKILTEW